MNYYVALEKAMLLYEDGRYDKLPALLLPVCTSSDLDEQESAYVLLSHAALMQDNTLQALKYVEKALAVGLSGVPILLCAGIVFNNAELYNQGLGHLRKALQIEPRNPTALTCLAQSTTV